MSKPFHRAASLALVAGLALAAQPAVAQAPNCPTMRKINIGVSVAPPNVVHTAPYVAKDLGYFAKRCIDVNIIQFDGGGSAASTAAGDVPPSNWMMLASMQCLAKRPSSFAT